MKTRVILGPMIPAMLLAAGMTVSLRSEAEEAGSPATADTPPAAAENADKEARARLARLLKQASLSRGVMDVAKLGDTGTGEIVMLAYVNNSEIAYKLRAEDIDYLQEHSVPDSIIAAMIERGAILRDRQPAPTTPPAPAVQNIIHATPQPANAVVFIPAPANYSAEPVSTVTVIGRSYGSRGLTQWNRPYVYARPGQFRNNASYSVWGGYRSCAPYGRTSYRSGYSRIACR